MDSASTLLIDDLCSDDSLRVSVALQAAASLQETLAPALLARLQDAVLHPTEWNNREGNPSPIFLLFLAAAWKETRAHPLIASLLRLPDQQCDLMFSDFLTDGANRVLADTWPGDLQAIEAIALDSNANPYARDAAISAAALLTHRGMVPREEVLALYTRIAVSPLNPKVGHDVTVASGLVATILDLHAWELRSTVSDLFERNLVNPGWSGNEDEVLAQLEPGLPYIPIEQFFPPPITNAWEEVSDWCFFDELYPERREPFTPLAEEEDFPELADDSPTPQVQPQPYLAPPLPYRAPYKPGRNDPCSCGSGKKYKKCCSG